MGMFGQTRWTALTATALLGSGIAMPTVAQAPQFGAAPVDSAKFVLVASPIGNGSKHQLLIIEQVSNKRKCWEESGSNPTMIKPLLLDFDFTGICDRKIDSNGYSIRVAGIDLGLQYRVSVVRQGNDMLLLGRPVRKGPDLLIARVGGATTGFAKFEFEPGWKLMRRTFRNKPLGHLYLLSDQIPAGLNLIPVSASPEPVAKPAATLTQPAAPRPTTAAKPSTQPRTAAAQPTKPKTTNQPMKSTQSSN
jgi:N-acetylmuramoyl-L-alanine amidase